MNKPWLRHYPESVPETINPDLFQSIPHLFADVAKQYADRPAVKCLGVQINYRELEKKTTQFATFLQQHLRMKKGDRIALMMPNITQYLIAMYGALKAGLVVVNVNPLYTERELTYQLDDAKADAILVLANFAHVVEAALSKVSVKHVMVTEIGDMHSFPKSMAMNFVVRHVKKAVKPFQLKGAIRFNKALSLGAKKQFTPVDINGDDLAFLQYTGGTTGVAKGAMLSHRNILSNLEQAFAWVQSTFTSGQECAAVVLPIYHMFSLVANVFMMLRAGSLSVLVPNPRDLPALVETFRENKFTTLMGVNTLFNALLGREKFRQLDLSSLHVILAGGMALHQTVADKWNKITGTVILEGFGLTETSPITCINPITNTGYNGSIGLPVPSTEAKIIDDDENDLPIGEVGELCFKGPQVMQGYWNRPDETANVFFGDGWVKTGDMARIDQKGYVYIVDRKKDMIDVAGFNVYPNEVESVIAGCPGVKEVAIIGVPHPVTGEVVKAYIVKEDDALTKGDLIAYCKKGLASYKVPKRFEFCEDLPKTNVGKILRRVLREQEAV